MRIALQTEPLDPGAVLTRFSSRRQETGAVVSFTGLCRAEAGGAEALELEAYPGFTERAIEAVAREAMEEFALDDLIVLHRVGRILPGEAIVFVATAARHRRSAFQAADRLMDYLKSQAPFWKKSIGPDGERWIEPSPQDYQDAERWGPSPAS
jgi:molybdopterin synthase catalytic subunit